MGSEYTRTDAQAANASKYVCAQTGSGVYSWELLGLAVGASGSSSARYVTQIPDGTLSNGQALSSLPTGVLKSTTGTGVLSVASGSDLPRMTGDAGTGGTAGAVPAPAAGDSAAGKFLRADGSWTAPPVGSSGAPTGARYVTQLPDGSLSNEQALSTLPTGILKSTTGTGRAERGQRIGLAADDG